MHFLHFHFFVVIKKVNNIYMDESNYIGIILIIIILFL